MTTQTTRTEKDACEICHGESGGTPGNENIIEGKVVCDYCHAKMMEPIWQKNQQ